MLYREQVGRSTPHDEVDRCLHQLVIARSRWRDTALALRIRLARLCLAGTGQWADRWVAAACQAKGLDPDSPAASEEMATGPMAVSRYLQLLIATLSDIEKYGLPQLPGEIVTGPAGQLRVQVFPARGLFDPILFRGFRGHAWMRPSVTRQNLPDHLAGEYRRRAATEGTALVLGAGNVAAIAATDMFAKLFHEGRVVLLKMNPVNEYLGPIFEAAFSALIAEGLLRVIYGGAEVGSYATHHELVDEVHITGSVQSHDTIVWGPPGPDRQWRIEHGGPVLTKPITSELGNVTPWIVVPGPYTDRQLDFQAENVASTIVNNASFNCIATKLIITWRGWPDRGRFLDKIRAVLAGVPRRRAYYPGAFERFRRFTGSEAGDTDGTLPWTLTGGVDPDEAPHWFSEESFVCACAETALEAAGEEDFLDRAVEFANRRVWGTLGAGLMVHPRFRRRPGNEA
ncbi:MAG: aldehyde dehydrogenase family protein, partial [Pirellulales bacterium]